MKKISEISSSTKIKFVVFSLIGLFVFFVSFQFNERNTIAVEHTSWLVRGVFGPLERYWALALIVYGCIRSIMNKDYQKGLTEQIFVVLKFLGLIFALLFITGHAPEVLLSGETTGSMLPFLYNVLAVNLSFLIPIGAAFLVFLTNYGLMEFVGVFARPLMRKVYKTPGRAAIDAVGSFVGSYALALLITDEQYRKKFYTKKEALIIATGFSTVSAAFVLVVARTLDLMDHWNFFFWTSLLICFIVTAITVYLPPIKNTPSEYIDGDTNLYQEPTNEQGGVMSTAIYEALNATDQNESFFKILGKTLWTGINITANFLPTILSVGLIGLLLVEYTPIFDILALLFYPASWLIQLGQPMEVARALSTSLAEMLLPAILASDMSLPIRYVVGVTSITSILFFSASIPCIKATAIPIKIPEIIIIWVIRVNLSIIIAGIFAHLFL